MAVQAGIQVGSSPISSLIYMKLTNTWMFNFSLNQCCPHSGLVQPLYILAHAVGLTWFWVLIVAPPLGQSEPQCHAEGRSSHILHVVMFKLKKCRHLSFHSTTVVSPPVLQHAILFLLCMSDVPLLGPWGVSPHIFKGGVGGMHNGFYIFVCLFFFPPLSTPPSNEVLPIPKTKTTHVSYYKFVTCFSLLFSGLESPGSCRPSWTEDMQNMYLSAMWITCGRKALWLMPMCWWGFWELSMNCGWMLQIKKRWHYLESLPAPDNIQFPL